jgi:F420-non-reducing hydrogenase large subunit
VTKANLLVGTTNNYAAMAMSVDKAARRWIQPGEAVGEGSLNRVEMAFRAYDPCFGCATHTQPGENLMDVRVYNPQGEVVFKRTRGA